MAKKSLVRITKENVLSLQKGQKVQLGKEIGFVHYLEKDNGDIFAGKLFIISKSKKFLGGKRIVKYDINSLKPYEIIEREKRDF